MKRIRNNHCSRCNGKKEPTRLNQAYCRSCHAAYMREHRPKHSELTDLQRKKANARAYAHVYRDRGLIKRENCNVCGSENSQMHHEDYDKPTQVIWLCRICHLKHHEISSDIQHMG